MYLWSNVVVAAELMIISTSPAIRLATCSSMPIFISRIFPATGTSLLEIKLSNNAPCFSLKHLKSSVFII